MSCEHVSKHHNRWIVMWEKWRLCIDNSATIVVYMDLWAYNAMTHANLTKIVWENLGFKSKYSIRVKLWKNRAELDKLKEEMVGQEKTQALVFQYYKRVMWSPRISSQTPQIGLAGSNGNKLTLEPYRRVRFTRCNSLFVMDEFLRTPRIPSRMWSGGIHTSDKVRELLGVRNNFEYMYIYVYIYISVCVWCKSSLLPSIWEGRSPSNKLLYILYYINVWMWSKLLPKVAVLKCRVVVVVVVVEAWWV